MEFEEIGLVLAGGGAKGAYQIGALKAMEELGLIDKIKVISGASIGGINLSLLLGSTIDKAYEAWKNFNGEDFLELDDNGFDILKYGDGIFTRESLLSIIRDNVDYSKISESDITAYTAVSFKDEDSTEKVRYAKLNGLAGDDIEKYLLATSAIPVIYDAVSIDGKLFYDGGIVDNTPIAPVFADNIKTIIVISNDNMYKTCSSDFPGTQIIDIAPSASLAVNMGIGTLDLDSSHSLYRLRLGYYDAKEILKAYIEDRKVPNLSGNSVLARNEMKIVNADKSARENISKLEDMLGKYGLKL